ncbi:Hsp20/alpha crystallin family protein [archaeon]|nr:Hsp20/alpha crystallin family protein [archaeon]
MTNDDQKKPWRRRNPFFDLFSEFDRMDNMMDDMMKRAFNDMDKLPEGKPMVYGFSMKVGPNGQPQIREFGNVEPDNKKLNVKDAREPLVDVIEHEKEIDVLAELPGVEKDDIDVRANEDHLIVEVPDEFYKEVVLPCDVDEKSVKARYKNGVLTITLKKKKPSKPKKPVTVE